jgi:hypothetical protein
MRPMMRPTGAVGHGHAMSTEQCYSSAMGNARASTTQAPAVVAARAAPKGPPLSEQERARVDAMRNGSPEDLIPHAEILRQLEERKHRGE